MANATAGADLGPIGALFGEGIVAGQEDGRLLDRFLADRDGLAFAALVERHGPMVLAVCRGTLRDRDDVEDAFQATFLVLVRKAGSIRGRDALGPWLHRVARRVATRANIEASRRRDRERRAGEIPRANGPDSDLRAALHEEIDRLPDRLRRPLVLCHLEEKTHAQTAFELSLGEATVRRRLASARELLRSRLARRGIAPALAASAIESASAAPLPPSWSAVAVRAARAATFPGGIIAPAASALSRGVLRSIALARFARAAAVVAACAVSGLVALGARTKDDPSPAPATAKAASPSPEAVAFRGRVVGPDGEPVAGATLSVDDSLLRQFALEEQARASSNGDGRFSIDVPRATVEKFARGDMVRPARLMASAPGFGPGWAELIEGRPDVTVRLAKDDVPIEGRVLDLEGRPVVGAVVHAEQILTPPGGDLAAWIDSMKAHPRSPWRGMDEMPFDARARTGPDGRFRIVGAGRERLVGFIVSGPGIELTRGYAMTRNVPDFAAGNHNVIAPETLVYHGARFDHVAAPSKPVVGVVRDRDTGRPIAGIRVNGTPFDEGSQAFYREVASTSDDQGRYRLDGMPRAERYQLFVFPGPGLPYPNATVIAPATSPAMEPTTIGLRLKRGVLVRGRITDKETGEPIRMARVEAHALPDNRHARDYPDFKGYEPEAWTDPDGRFEIATIPGPGFLAVRAPSPRYLTGVGAESIPGMAPERSLAAPPSISHWRDYHAFAPIDPPAGGDPATCDLRLEPGKTVTGRLVDPDGRPVVGALAAGLGGVARLSERPLDSDAFHAVGDPRRPRRLDFFHRGRGLGGSLVLDGKEDGPFVVTLRPLGFISGQIVDADGRPCKGLELTSFTADGFDPCRGILWGTPGVDHEGRFRIEAIPGLVYEANAVAKNRAAGKVFGGVQVKPGEVRDLGDVRLKTKK